MEQQDRLTVTILIVEDHPPTLMAVQRLVAAAFPACRMLAAESGEQALELCARHAPQIVVMDIVLPGMDGIEATRRIKSLLPDTRVVMHSNHDLQIYRDGSAAAGASAFVAKSKTFTDLVPVITGLLSPSRLPLAAVNTGNPPRQKPTLHDCQDFPTDGIPAPIQY